MNGHHLILGELTDYITGETLQDTHDERYRQKLARLLIDGKQYPREEVSRQVELRVRAADKLARIRIDFVVSLSSRPVMIVRYGPGSIVTRRRPALAASRLIASHQIPVVVVTNGESAEILDGASGEVLSFGLGSIPSRHDLLACMPGFSFDPISPERAELESRILYAFDVDDICPCDDTVCLL
ncbi:MAG: hypothetical protein C4530_06275 [Desulfobacteraceae bacterium]|nr:MAG: hypothetical protein C4530_06275 [Desulfobacteraceae bacterium]